MLKEASPHLIIPEPSDDLISSEPWTIEVYADGLMDEIFADLDHVLDANGNFISQTVNVEYVPLQKVKMPEIVLPDELHQVAVQGLSQMREKPLSKVVLDTPAKKAVIRKLKKSKRSFGTLLILGTTIVGVAIAGIIYLLNPKALGFLSFKPFTAAYLQTPQTQLPVKVDVQAELVDYMLGALSVIEQKQVKNHQSYANPNSRQALAVVNQPGGLILPAPVTANNTAPAPTVTKNIVERIYIPVEQALNPMRYAPPIIPAQPKPPIPVAAASSSTPANAVKNALNSAQKPAKPVNVNIYAAAVRTDLKPVNVRTAPITVGQTSNLLPTLPVVPFRAAPPPLPTPTTSVNTTSEAQAVIAAQPATPSHVLEGILELGTKSAALFKIEGTTRRFSVGENIGSSGWTLVDVSNGEAVIRRNGEVRSIYTGQKL
jgi:hypothetical protein